MTQPGKPETSGNQVSEGQEKLRRTSIESPKASPPPCLGEGFICLFRRKNNSLDNPSVNLNTEDAHEVQVKKRKILGGKTFWLPCITSSEKTDRDEQNNGQMEKTDGEDNQAIPEEELKPYSKASFLRRIRGYRLMKEKDASGKEKVFDMNASKEGPLVEELQEKQLGLDGHSAKSKSQEEVLGENEKDFVQKERLGGNNSYVVKQENSLAREQGHEIKEHENKVENLNNIVQEKDSCEDSKGTKDGHSKQQENQVESIVENKLPKQENQENMGVVQKDNIDSCTKLVKDLSIEVSKQDGQAESVLKPEKNMTEQEVSTLRVQESKLLGQEQTAKSVGNPENEPDKLPVKENCKEHQAEFRTKQDSFNEKVEEVKQGRNVEASKDLRINCVAEDGRNEKHLVDTPATYHNLLDIEQREKVAVPLNDVLEKVLHVGKASEGHKTEGANNSKNVERHSTNEISHTENVRENIEHSNKDKEEMAMDHFLEQNSNKDKEKTAEDHFLEQNSQREPDTFLVEEDGHLENFSESKVQKLKLKSNAKEQQETCSQLREQYIGDKGKEPRIKLCTEPREEAKDQLLEHSIKQEKHQRNHMLSLSIENKEETRDQFREQCKETEKEPTDHLQKQLTEHSLEPRDQLLGKCADQGGEAKDQFPDAEPRIQILAHCVEHEEPRHDDHRAEPVKAIPEENRSDGIKMFTDTTCIAIPDESHAPALQVTLHDNQKINLEDKAGAVIEHQGPEWESLQVEVKGMVQWLVEEASDKLTCYTQECHSTE